MNGVEEAVKELHSKGWPIFKIAHYLDLSLTHVRRILDPRAARLHKEWKR